MVRNGAPPGIGRFWTGFGASRPVPSRAGRAPGSAALESRWQRRARDRNHVKSLAANKYPLRKCSRADYIFPMQAVLLVDHGSRRAESNEQLFAIAELVRQRLPGSVLVGAGHMELAEPSIETALDELVRRGAMQIVVVPYLLAPGRHASTDIPNLAERAASKHPGLRVVTSECLGVDDVLADLVIRRARGTGLQP